MIAICITILVKHYTTIYTGKVYVFEGLTTIYPYFEVAVTAVSGKRFLSMKGPKTCIICA